ncbi:MAG TPA: hypothetical protein VM639_01360 [Dongiaceae bacterium]|nr:hypothetical protein [Dongiaceae bacterium]
MIEMVGFLQKALVFNIAQRTGVSGCEDDLDRGKFIVQLLAQLFTVHGAGHDDIGEDEIGLAAGRQIGPGFVRGAGLDDTKSGGAKFLCEEPSIENLVLYQEDIKLL